MISQEEINILLKYTEEKYPSKLFEYPEIIVSWKGPIKLGTRKTYIDFPRIFYSIQNWMLWYITSKIQSLQPQSAEELEKVVNEIKRDKDNPVNHLGFLTEQLKNLGISWSCIYQPLWYKKPSIKFYTDKYFKKLWPIKLRQFVEELNTGDDSPVKIYQKAQMLTPEYKKPLKEVRRFPKIFEKFLKSINPSKDIDKLWKISLNLQKQIASKKDVLFCQEIDEIVMDVKTIIHQLYVILNSGHCFNGYFLLRKLLTDFGYMIFYDSFRHWILKQGIVYPRESEEDYREILHKYCRDFPSRWDIMYIYPDAILFREKEDEKDLKVKKVKFTDINVLRSEHKKGTLVKDLIGSYVEFKDRFLIDVLEIVAVHSIDVFEFIERDDIVISSNMVLEEYRKLSEVIHEPIYIDFPPFSSLLEYLGFIHHLRKVGSILQCVVKNYRNIKKRRQRKRE